MTHEEVMDSLISGDKLTKTSWPKGSYVYLKDGYLHDSNDERSIAVFSDSEKLGEWEVFKRRE